MTIKTRFELSAVESNTLLTLSAVVAHLSQIAGAGRNARFFRRCRAQPPPAQAANRRLKTCNAAMNDRDKPGPAA
ncbi:MAG: hypothetical protein WEA28_09985 [Xanthobacteraceae bacterium]